MPWVDTPRCGEAYQRRQIWEHERSLGDGQRDGHARFLVVLIGLALIPSLYPIAAAMVAATAGGAGLLAREVAGLRGGAAMVAMALPALAVLVVLVRLEQRLGTFGVYRWTRRVVRALIPAVILDVIVQEGAGASAPDASRPSRWRLGSSRSGFSPRRRMVPATRPSPSGATDAPAWPCSGSRLFPQPWCARAHGPRRFARTSPPACVVWADAESGQVRMRAYRDGNEVEAAVPVRPDTLE